MDRWIEIVGRFDYRSIVVKIKKAAPPWMAAENLLASFFYLISVCSEMGTPPHIRGELRR
jgi:hypothetical protein